MPKDDVADPETTTPNGCTCTSLCGASADDLFRVSMVKNEESGFFTFTLIHVLKILNRQGFTSYQILTCMRG